MNGASATTSARRPIRIPDDVTLGLLAGGRATRLGGLDKAWLQRDGDPQVLRWQRRFRPEVAAILVSSQRDHARLRAAGLSPVADRIADRGPMSALDALSRRCGTPWLLTLPVDLVAIDDGVLQALAPAAGEAGAFAEDDGGVQPLVALWNAALLREAAAQALADDRPAVRALQARLGMHAVRFHGARFGNLNTPLDLAQAGFDPI